MFLSYDQKGSQRHAESEAHEIRCHCPGRARVDAGRGRLPEPLFDGELPDAFLVFQRQAHSGGHFSPDRYVRRDARDSRQHEINLSPDHFVGETDEKIVSTLAHEMTHLWQHV
jgi:hypothetical protein